MDARAAEAEDVDASVAGDVGQEARVAVDSPAARILVVPESAAYQLGLLEAAVAFVARHPDAFVAEADDVRVLIAGDVGEETEVPLAPPPLGLPVVVQNKPGTLERAVAAPTATTTP